MFKLLGFNGTNTTSNVQEYVLGGGAAARQFAGTAGTDGSTPTAADLIGDPIAKTGLHGLDNVGLFNLLCLPAAANLDSGNFTALMSAAIAYCEDRRAFLLVDIPKSVDTPQKIQDWVAANASTIESPNAAVYFPRVQLPDPTDEYRMRSFPTSGTIAGIYARTDSDRGVWKAPAGIDAAAARRRRARLPAHRRRERRAQPAGHQLPARVPGLRPGRLGGAHAGRRRRRAREWKYVPIRRLGAVHRGVAVPRHASGSCSSRTTSRCGRRFG